MEAVASSVVNGLHFRLVFFDYVYMMGEFLSALSELHVKVQLVDRYCNKVLHNLKLMERRRASEAEIREFIRRENGELVAGLKRQNIFYDKYRLRLLRLIHQGTEGELLVEDTYNGSQFVVPVKRVMDRLLQHVFDSTPIPDMNLFSREQEVVALTSTMDDKPGDTAQQVLIQLEDAARNVHVYVKKEKIAGVQYLSSGRLVTDPAMISQAEAQTSDKERFLNDPLVRSLFGERR